MVLDTHPWMKELCGRPEEVSREVPAPCCSKKKFGCIGVGKRTLISNMKIHNTLVKVYRLMFYVSLVVTTKQKPAVDSQNVKRISKHTIKIIINLQSKAARKMNKAITKQLENGINKSLPINTLNINGLNSITTITSPPHTHKTEWLNGLKIKIKRIELYMLLTRHSF